MIIVLAAFAFPVVVGWYQWRIHRATLARDVALARLEHVEYALDFLVTELEAGRTPTIHRMRRETVRPS
jgi:hypothetical protein